MRKLVFIICLSFLLFSCSNKKITFPDFTYNSVYFPIQYPLRTLVLGDSRSDNSLDKNLQFHIGVSIGGLRENKRDWNVDFIVDPSLVPWDLVTTSGDTLRVLPTSYYKLSHDSKIVIPKGSLNGLILVQLDDRFLDDSLAITGNYVIPMRITGTDADSILVGSPFVPNPSRLNQNDWEPGSLPKDYTLFGIKYINPYHGVYLHRGVDIGISSTGDTVSQRVYHQRYVESDQLWKLTTTGRNSLVTDGVGAAFNSNSKLTLQVGKNGVVNVSSQPSSVYPATGSGVYLEDVEEWGGEKHNAFYLKYIYMDGTVSHVVSDTLVFRDNGVAYEENHIVVE